MSISYDLVSQLKQMWSLSDEDIESIRRCQITSQVYDNEVIQDCASCGDSILHGLLDIEEELLDEHSAHFMHGESSYCFECSETAIQHLVMQGASKIFCLGLAPDEIENLKGELRDDAESGFAKPSGRSLLGVLAFTEEDIELKSFPFVNEAVSLCQEQWTKEEEERGIENLDSILSEAAIETVNCLLLLLIQATGLPLERQEAVYSEITSRYMLMNDDFEPELLKDVEALLARSTT